jgi:methylenetetrahydrofolate reductase (NADPH)
MHIKEILSKRKTTFSFEFFPPKTKKGAEKLFLTIKQLEKLKPSFVSVTYGAGGSTRDLTHQLVLKLKRETSLEVIPHLTCVLSTQKEIYTILKNYVEAGIDNVMALRGDIPKGFSGTQSEAFLDFSYASDLVKFIKQEFPQLGIGVAGYPEGHPETPNRLQELDNLKRKVDSGADYICTQLFFDNHIYWDFVNRCRLIGIKIPIIAGIMPIISKKNFYKMAELSAGTNFPAGLNGSQRAAIVTLINSFSPANMGLFGVKKYFTEAPTESWNPKT